MQIAESRDSMAKQEVPVGRLKPQQISCTGLEVHKVCLVQFCLLMVYLMVQLSFIIKISIL